MLRTNNIHYYGFKNQLVKLNKKIEQEKYIARKIVNLDIVFCPMCEVEHENNTFCQANFSHGGE